MDLKVVQTEPTLQKATASAVMKPATLETGLVVNVPPFVNEGDRIRWILLKRATCSVWNSFAPPQLSLPLGTDSVAASAARAQRKLEIHVEARRAQAEATGPRLRFLDWESHAGVLRPYGQLTLVATPRSPAGCAPKTRSKIASTLRS